jgi:tripartite-type tricarboxylate transporter receptor subunit TctC
MEEHTVKAVVAGISLAVLFAGSPAALNAQTYPTKPVRIIAPYPAGGTSDTIARILGRKLTEAWGQQTIVENRAGVNGSIGSAAVAKSPPDGYTLLVGNVGPVAVNVSVYKSVGYDPIRDFAPVTLAVTSPQLVVVHPSVPAKTFREFAELAKRFKGKLNYGSSGPGSISHLSAELFKRKGSALITVAAIAGEVDVVFSDMAVVLPHVKTGKLRALAVTSSKPTPLVPGVPSVAESGFPGYEMTSWWGVLAPAGTPQSIISRLNTELVRILQLPDVKENFATLGVDAVTSTPEEFGAFIKSEVGKYAKLIREIGLKAE